MTSLYVRFLRALPLLLLAGAVRSPAEPVRVRYPQGSTHGFVALRDSEGKAIATGELTETVRGDVVSARIVFRFRDGSIDDDATVFSQRGTFHLISDHHIQRGPSYPKPIDCLIETESGLVTSKAPDGKVTQEHMDLPSDLSNGLPPNLLLNILPSAPETKISYLAPGPKPRLIHLSIRPAGTASFKVGGMRHKANDFLIHVELGGVAGVVAPIIGKQPSDYHIWIMPGNPPAFIREEGQLYEGGPIWRMEQISATFAP